MAKKPWKLSDINQRDILDMDNPFEVAVLPVGSTEPHNYHLPYCTDNFQAEMIADRVCEEAWKNGARVVLLPTIPFGLNWNLMKFPMTLHVNPSTHMAIIQDIVESLAVHGIKKLLIFNGHGGNEFGGIVRELYAKSDTFICVTHWWKAPPKKDTEVFAPGGHADDLETSACLSLIPDLVFMENADKGKYFKSRFKAAEDGSVWFSRPWHLFTESSGMGDPTAATAEKGEIFIKAAVEKLAGFLKELSDAEMDEKFPY